MKEKQTATNLLNKILNESNVFLIGVSEFNTKDKIKIPLIRQIEKFQRNCKIIIRRLEVCKDKKTTDNSLTQANVLIYTDFRLLKQKIQEQLK